MPDPADRNAVARVDVAAVCNKDSAYDQIGLGLICLISVRSDPKAAFAIGSIVVFL
jgi:hypothetical protein